MKLSETLSAPLNFATLTLPELTAVQRAVHRVMTTWPNVVVAPEEKDRERLVQEMKGRLDGCNWEGARVAMVCRAAHAAFDDERRAISDLAPLRDFYCREI